MKKHYFNPITLVGLSAVACSNSNDKYVDLPEKPNVIFIMSDDQGYGDFGFNGNPEMRTPNIDKFASESIRFTDFHVCTSSAPTRSSLMSGQYCNNVGVWHTIMGREILSSNVTTLPQFFQNSGYKTAMFGKWHLGDLYPYRPFDRGFDHAVWHGGGGVGQAPDFWNNDYFDDVYKVNNKPKQFEGYCTDVFFSEAMEYIKENKDDQFFCYISTNAPHSPHNVAPEYSKRYKKSDYILDPNYFGMIENLDDNMGKLNAFLKEQGLDKNTIIVFTTDNGTASGAASFDKPSGKVVKGYNAGMRGGKGTAWDGGHRTPLLIHIPGNEKNAREVDQLTGVIDIIPTFVDMLGLKADHKQQLDGISILPVIKGDETPIERYLFADVQRGEFLSKDATSSVMKKDWRLMNRKALYNIAQDPGQTTDIAADHPEIVAELLAQHDLWWESLEGLNDDSQMAHIPLAAPGEESVVLLAHDCHDPLNRQNVYNQVMVRSATRQPADTFWAIEVPEDGIYNFDLYRWAIETGLALEASAPKPIVTAGIKTSAEGVSIKGITEGVVKIGNIEKRAKVGNPKTDCSIAIHGVELKKGRYKMNASFIQENKPFGAYYVKVTKK